MGDLNRAFVVEHANAWGVGYHHAGARPGLCDAFTANKVAGPAC